ncbi:hypothetical protein GUJ93_ZPchr0458g22272 [Zizania palustris]|uniref:DUF674 family protein n=1 Tax=Zizania palustris TaxID=103762 RepID=A0A8J5RDH8_ZIZPA|nr:hypothetical protein GUJ93_ZPchr0458g22272 [Zizania palustris]
MEYIGEWPQDADYTAAPAGSNGVFVKGCFKFIITDDLQVAPASTSLMLSLFEKFRVRDPVFLEQINLQLNAEKISSLLKRSLTTNQALTALYFNVPCTNDDSSLYTLPENLHCKQEADVDNKPNNVKIKVLQTKNNLLLLYADVGDDFIDLLFGLLSIPLGSIIRTYGKRSSTGCVDSIYSSIDGSAMGYMNPERLTLLQSPNVAPFYGSGISDMLQAEEAAPRQKLINRCFKCFKNDGFSCHARCEVVTPFFALNSYVHAYSNCKVWSASPNCNYRPCSARLREVDPKLPRGGSHTSVGFVKPGNQKFMVTDDLRVLPLSLTSTMQVVSESKIPSKDLVEKELSLTKVQVMELLRAAAVTRNTLSSALLPPRKKLHRLSSSLY